MALSQKQFAMGKPFTQRSRGVSAGRCAAPRRAPSTVRAATAPQAAPAKFIPRWDLVRAEAVLRSSHCHVVWQSGGLCMLRHPRNAYALRASSSQPRQT